MSAHAVEEVIARAVRDPAFRKLIGYDPDGALHGYDISMPERQALIAGDVSKLEQLGVSAESSLLAGQINREESHIP